jgi:opacity protein-like surface antigen
MNRATWLVLALALCLGTSAAEAQRRKAEIAVLGGWQFGGSLNTYQGGSLSIKDALAITGVVDINLQQGGQLELMYDWQGTQVNLGGTKVFDADLHYMQIGGLGYVDKGKVEPFGVATLGLTYINPKDSQYSGETRFSFTLGGGAKVFPTERIGLRFEGRLLMTVIDGALGLGCGGAGCSGGFWGWGMAQGVVSAGLILAF